MKLALWCCEKVACSCYLYPFYIMLISTRHYQPYANQRYDRSLCNAPRLHSKCLKELCFYLELPQIPILQNKDSQRGLIYLTVLLTENWGYVVHSLFEGISLSHWDTSAIFFVFRIWLVDLNSVVFSRSTTTSPQYGLSNKIPIETWLCFPHHNLGL